MPKKTQRRSTRNRPRTRQPIPPRQAGAATLEAPEVIEEAPTRQPLPSRPTISPRTVRRSTVPAINYAYLKRDLRSLAVLAPTMVALVVVAFLFLH